MPEPHAEDAAVRPTAFSALPEVTDLTISGIPAKAGFRWVRPGDIELSEWRELEGKTIPETLTSGIRDGWEASGIPPVFAVHSFDQTPDTTISMLLQDGHRRWKASMSLRPGSPIPVIWVDADAFYQLLEEFGDRLGVRDEVFRALQIQSTGKVPECHS